MVLDAHDGSGVRGLDGEDAELGAGHLKVESFPGYLRRKYRVEILGNPGRVDRVETLRVHAHDIVGGIVYAEDDEAPVIVGEGGEGSGILGPIFPVEGAFVLETAVFAGDEPHRVGRVRAQQLAGLFCDGHGLVAEGGCWGAVSLGLRSE